MNFICKTDDGILIPNKGMLISGAVTQKPNVKKIKVVFADSTHKTFDVLDIQTRTSITDAMNAYFLIDSNLPATAFGGADVYGE